MQELKIDPELKDLLPPLTEEEYKQLEKNIVENGFDNNFPIMEWHGYIVDGHNRYSICRKHNIDYVVGTLAYETKDEVIEWMLDIQLGRRNLTPIQKISIAEKYRPIYEKQAKERQATSTGGANPQLVPKLVQAETNPSANKTNTKLANLAGVGKETYRMGAKILNSDNEKLKQEVLSGKKSINAGYKELTGKKENNKKEEIIDSFNSESSISVPIAQAEISEETKQICADLKTEKPKEYLDSIWNYKISVIECMNADFEMFYDGFVSTLREMNGKVNASELRECIENAENNIEKLLFVIEEAKNTKLRMER